MSSLKWRPFCLDLHVLKYVSHSILTQTNINCWHTMAPLSLGQTQRPPNGHIVLVFAGPTILAPKAKCCQDRIHTSYSMVWHFPQFQEQSLYTKKSFQGWIEINSAKMWSNNCVTYTFQKHSNFECTWYIFTNHFVEDNHYLIMMQITTINKLKYNSSTFAHMQIITANCFMLSWLAWFQ